MYSFAVIHESRNLKQARFDYQYVDLLRSTLATPSWDVCLNAITNIISVNPGFYTSRFTHMP